MSIPAPDNITGELLRYWLHVLEPVEGRWTHPEDVARHERMRAAIRLLLEEFFDD